MSPITRTASIVIVCWNSAAYLPRCLASLVAQTFRDFEVVIVDNASTDGATAKLEGNYPGLSLHVRHLDSNQGFAAANNIGAQLAQGKWLALLNPDAFPEPDWLEQLMQAAAEFPQSVFFASRQVQADRPYLLDGEGDAYHVSGLAWRLKYNWPVFPAGEPSEVFSASAAAALYPRQEFLDAGGFDEDYFAYFEDVDLGFRLRLRGLRCLVVPKAVVQHIGSASTSKSSDLAIYHGHRNLVWTYVKDMPSVLFWVYLSLHLASNIYSLIYFTLRGRARAIWRAKLDALRGLPDALRKRRLVQHQRQVPAREIYHALSSRLFAPLESWVARIFPQSI